MWFPDIDLVSIKCDIACTGFVLRWINAYHGHLRREMGKIAGYVSPMSSTVARELQEPIIGTGPYLSLLTG